ncbi:MAG: demethylmenaquinone methyltransferase/2-methoxy-6-polyprenyl-1,4-benzoquinol methylase [Granulosicoccus sp.]|jgi:demethylmenaquinone methyltransferase/2-methoxy-6-polyprenyl-1,4-benzoquinol methylase
MTENPDSSVVKPYSETGSKKEQVTKMFDSIAPRYDLLNRVLSLGIDIIWRRIAIKKLRDLEPQSVLDVATGTGDVILEIERQLSPARMVGLDISAGMLELGTKKIRAKEFGQKVEMIVGDSEDLPFKDNTFDAITVAFGVRNFENLNKGLTEMYRVLKPGGKLMVLEFSHPKKAPVKQIYWAYFNHILPFFGKMVSKDSSAYTYLPESVKQFPDGELFIEELKTAGYQNMERRSLTFGIASIYLGSKN